MQIRLDPDVELMVRLLAEDKEVLDGLKSRKKKVSPAHLVNSMLYSLCKKMIDKKSQK